MAENEGVLPLRSPSTKDNSKKRGNIFRHFSDARPLPVISELFLLGAVARRAGVGRRKAVAPCS
jgi:hypothetical protein